MSVHQFVGVRALRHFLAPLARNLSDMVFKLRRTLGSDFFAALNAFECLRFIRICGHSLVVRSDIVNIHSADAYDRR